jgi:hypothetical protein
MSRALLVRKATHTHTHRTSVEEEEKLESIHMMEEEGQLTGCCCCYCSAGSRERTSFLFLVSNKPPSKITSHFECIDEKLFCLCSSCSQNKNSSLSLAHSCMAENEIDTNWIQERRTRRTLSFRWVKTKEKIWIVDELMKWKRDVFPLTNHAIVIWMKLNRFTISSLELIFFSRLHKSGEIFKSSPLASRTTLVPFGMSIRISFL